MRKVLVSLALASAALVAAPASAQYGYHGGHGYYGQGHYGQGHYGQGHYGQGYHHQGYRQNAQIHHRIERDIAQLENRIYRSAQRGRISRGEAISLSRQVNRLQHDFYRFSRNGLSQGEVHNVAVRIERIRYRLQRDRYDGYQGW